MRKVKTNSSKIAATVTAASNGGPERTIGLLAAINIIIGIIIGSGVFLTPGAVLSHSGSIGLSLVVWAASGCMSLLGEFWMKTFGRPNWTYSEFMPLYPICIYNNKQAHSASPSLAQSFLVRAASTSTCWRLLASITHSGVNCPHFSAHGHICWC